ncbi:MAG: hypothetical protein H8E78_11440 [Proteobacteria bacterium]|nr:hypothetical protein [Pseudomonadota bacterium]
MTFLDTPVETSLFPSEELAELYLTPSMALSAKHESVATIDLDAGLEAALEDFGNDVSEVAAADPIVEAISSDSILLEEEPIGAPIAEVTIAEPAAADLVEVELAPLEADEPDQLDDMFVELIEE